MIPRVLFEQDGLLAIDKPPGLESTGRTPDDPGGLQAHVAASLRRPVWLVHQLDRDTSGVLLFVRRRSLVAPWQRRLGDPKTKKRYVALVRGAPGCDRTLTHPLAYDRRARRWVVRAGGRRARTHVRVVATAEERALLELTLVTGRTHQARVHLAHEGSPLVGERRYVEPPDRTHERHALHLHTVEVADGPTLTSALAPDLISLAASLGFAREAAAYSRSPMPAPS